MRRESYLSQPSKIEIYPVFSGTDVILRKNIELVEKEEIQDGKKSKYKVWECDEVQFHYQGEVTESDVLEKFEYWFSIANGEDEVKAIENEAASKNEPTLIQRLEALENGLAELAEVMCNG